MKNLLFLVGGASLAAFVMLVKRRRAEPTARPVEELAHRLQDAWADHHTVV